MTTPRVSPSQSPPPSPESSPGPLHFPHRRLCMGWGLCPSLPAPPPLGMFSRSPWQLLVPQREPVWGVTANHSLPGLGCWVRRVLWLTRPLSP